MNKEHNDRKDLLEKLLAFNTNDINALRQKLNNYFEWDCETPLVILTVDHIFSILNKYTEKKITSQSIEDWANIIEMREDIGYESGKEDIISDTIFELANPEINYQLNDSEVVSLIERLKR